MCDQPTLDGILRLVAKGNQLPTCPTWPNLKDELTETELFSEEDLEKSQEYIIRKFGQLRIERMQQHTNALIGKSTSPKLASNGGSTSSELPNDDSASEISSRGFETDEEEALQPTLDDEAIAQKTRFMSMYLNGIWNGAVLKYCHQPNSFVHIDIVERHSLEVVNGRIQLTWKFDDSDKSHVTQFLVREDLESDFIMGKRCSDEAFNREVAIPPSKMPKPVTGLFEHPISPVQGLGHHSTQTWVNSTVPNTKLLGDVIYHLERNYREQIIPEPVPYMLPQQGGIVGEGSHSSTASSVPHHGPGSAAHSRKSRSKTNRSNSKSTR